MAEDNRNFILSFLESATTKFCDLTRSINSTPLRVLLELFYSLGFAILTIIVMCVIVSLLYFIAVILFESLEFILSGVGIAPV